METIQYKKLISDNVASHFVIWFLFVSFSLIVVTAVLLKLPYYISSFSLIIISIIIILDLFIFFSIYFFLKLIINTRKIEIDTNRQEVLISSYHNSKESFAVPLVSIRSIEKKFTHFYKFNYFFEGKNENVIFHSLDLDLKYFLPSYYLNNFHNSKVLFFTEMVLKIKNEKNI